MRAIKHPGSKHLIVRKHGVHLAPIWYQTYPEVLKKCFPGIKVEENKKDRFITFPNGSQVWFAGTDDKERIEKVLGWEWETIFINEGSQISFDIYETLKTRLNPGQGIKPLFIIDYNPPSKRHWGYMIFHRGLNPETGQPIDQPERYAKLHMNPSDNVVNLSDTYIKTLESMSERKRNRFLHGNYSDDTEGALWRREWIQDNRVKNHPDLESVVVAVDPAVSGNEKSDDTGIIVAGSAYDDEGNQHFYVLADVTVHGDVTGWGRAVCEAYRKYMADRVVGEVNNGGDLVEVNIRNHDKDISYKSVRATRGKAVRAEPIADLYERGRVHHVGEFIELEDMCCSWTAQSDESPDNMDALVWGITYLSDTDGGEIYSAVV